MRTILHCDLNSFFASVEIRLHPELKGKAVAVCGSVEERHGIVLAKSDLAKAYGVTTGEAVWEAQRKCPDLIIAPPRFDEYMKFSKMARGIYEKYTDMIEPFGMDECWLDVTGSLRLFGSGESIADEIRTRMKAETGLTVSIGVSFNKVFAKLGSDMKKPDAVTVIPESGFREMLKNVPASDMLGVGRRTAETLRKYCIETIGELAAANPDFLERKLGKCGRYIWLSANGLDSSPVSEMNFTPPVKSIGHGTTCSADLEGNGAVRTVFIRLSQDIGCKLRSHGLFAEGVQIAVRDKFLCVQQYQCRLPFPTQNFRDIYECAYELFVKSYDWHAHVRSLTVRAINLTDSAAPKQLNFNTDCAAIDKVSSAESAMERIRKKYGRDSVELACLLADVPLPKKLHPNTFPNAVGE